MNYELFSRVPVAKLPHQLIKQPEEVLVLTSKKNNCEQIILLTSLMSLNARYCLKQYDEAELAYGELPYLILHNKVVGKRQLVETLGSIFYSSDDLMWNERHKAFTREVSQRFSRIIHYYSNYSNTFGGVNHITDLEMKRDCIELFEMLMRSLIENTFDFEERPDQAVKMPFADIVVWAYLKGIRTWIPESEPDILLRTYYSDLLFWQVNINESFQQIQRQQGQYPRKEIYVDLELTVREVEDRPRWKVNWQRSLVTVSIAALLYGLFV